MSLRPGNRARAGDADSGVALTGARRGVVVVVVVAVFGKQRAIAAWSDAAAAEAAGLQAADEGYLRRRRARDKGEGWVRLMKQRRPAVRLRA